MNVTNAWGEDMSSNKASSNAYDLVVSFSGAFHLFDIVWWFVNLWRYAWGII